MKNKRRYQYQKVSLGGIVREKLPLPYVHYPHHYGAFFSFSETENSLPFLCECSKSAVYNYLEFRRLNVNETQNYQYFIGNHFDQLNFPQSIVHIFMNQDDPLNQLKFTRALCHRCNMTPPTLRYCHEEYGVKFIQHFGWYVKQAYLRYGILGTTYLDTITPLEYVNDILVIREAGVELNKAREWFSRREELTRLRIYNPTITLPAVDYDEIYWHQDELRKAQRDYSRSERVLSEKIKNIVREEFGYKKVGESWTSETILYQIVCKLFPKQQVLFHHKPEWLDGLEIDIFIPKLKLAIEYQGQQHFHPIKIWGGENALIELQGRDAKKVKICKENNIRLITFDYTEPLTTDYVDNVIGMTDQGS